MSQNYLGKEIKKLGFGFMRLPLLEDSQEIDIEQSKKMVDLYLEKGYTYFDTAVGYLGQRSEIALKTCLTDRYPRESYQIATKMSAHFIEDDLPPEKMFQRSLERIGVDYVDFYLLHAMNRINYEKYKEVGAFSLLQKLKSQGKIKHYGLSFHDRADALEMILEAHPDIEFVQLQLNYADWENPGIQSRKCYEVAQKYKKPVVVMEPVRGGMLTRLPEAAVETFQKAKPEDSLAKWALGYVAQLDNVITILSGMSSLAQVEENCTTFDQMEPFTKADFETIDKVMEIMNALPNIPCTECDYCVKDCPSKINIPLMFRIMNVHLRYDKEGAVASNRGNFNFNTKGMPLPSACIACQKCEKTCPQGINIIEQLVRVKETYEENL
ncbi:MAG: aldo/keto reductase [Eubacteriales bacterium]